MKQGVLKIDDLNPDGVRVVVKWDNLVVGSSMFIPCVNTEEAMRQAAKILDSTCSCPNNRLDGFRGRRVVLG